MPLRDVPPPKMPGAVTDTADGASPGKWLPDDWKNPLVNALEGQHPYYATVNREWVKMGLLYLGGYMMRQQATEFLERRDRELQEIYQARVDKFTDKSILGMVLGWYQAALFKNPPAIEFGIVDKDGSATSQKLSPETEGFFNRFRKDCDRGGTSLIDFFSQVFVTTLIYQYAYVLIDLPKLAQQPASLREQKQAGGLDPFLMAYPPTNVINWGEDAYGNLDWCILATQSKVRPFLQKQKTVDTWVYFDRQNFARWEFAQDTDDYSAAAQNANARAQLVDFGQHALAKANECPLRRIQVPDGLWLANRAYLPLIDYLNGYNAYKWALRIGCLAMPIVTGAPNYKPTLSETGFINLPAGATWAWSEPEGKSYNHMALHLADVREDIYRLLYVTYQGKQSSAVSDSASGESKKTDMLPAQDVLNELGDVMQSGLQKVLDLVAKARGEVNVAADARWPDIGQSSTLEDIEKGQAILATGIKSEGFNKEVQKEMMNSYLPNANPEAMEEWRAEVDAAPSDEEAAAQLADKKAKQFAMALAAANQPQPGNDPQPEPQPAAKP